VLNGRFGPYVQLARRRPAKAKSKNKAAPRIRDLGVHPETGEKIVANVGRFGPYIAHNTKPKPDFRSLKTDDVYKIELPRALEILKEEKKAGIAQRNRSRLLLGRFCEADEQRFLAEAQLLDAAIAVVLEHFEDDLPLR
jgi:topoisomerase IA-like protein